MPRYLSVACRKVWRYPETLIDRTRGRAASSTLAQRSAAQYPARTSLKGSLSNGPLTLDRWTSGAHKSCIMIPLCPPGLEVRYLFSYTYPGPSASGRVTPPFRPFPWRNMNPPSLHAFTLLCDCYVCMIGILHPDSQPSARWRWI